MSKRKRTYRRSRPKRFVVSRPAILAALLLIPVTAFALYTLFRERPDIQLRIDEPLHLARRDQQTKLGGVARPQTDVLQRREVRDLLEEVRTLQRESIPKGSILDMPEKYPILRESMNPNVKNTLIAVKTGKFPERLTPNIQPAPFNQDQYDANPQAYLDVVEPGRVYQSAQPGPGTKTIGVVGKRRHTIRQLESVRLRVKTAPSAPVTFTSFDMGAFSNHLPSITVSADETGLAEAVFTGTAGTTDDVDILAASPVTAGRIHFVVSVIEN